MRVHHGWSVFFVALSIAVFFFYRQYQPHVSYDFVDSFDGNDYRLAYQYFAGTQDCYEVPPPFHQRILIPFLASQFGEGIIKDFQIINLIFSILAVWVTFLVWRKLGLEFKWMVFGFIWLIFHWSGMMRLNSFDPITVDVPLYLFHALLIWIVLTRKFTWLYWLAPIATAQKESFIGYLVVLSIYALWHNRKAVDGYFKLQPILISTGLAILTKLVISHYFPPAEPGRGALIMIAYQAKQVLMEPFELIRWLAAISMAYGIALWLATAGYWRNRYFDLPRNVLGLFALISLAYALLAGGDMTRIAFLGFPFVFSFVLTEIQRADHVNFYALALLSLPFMMLQSAIPDPGFEWVVWEQWYPEFADPKIVWIVIGYALIASLLLSRSRRPQAIPK